MGTVATLSERLAASEARKEEHYAAVMDEIAKIMAASGAQETAQFLIGALLRERRSHDR
ncbi:MAG: hypothetical protein ACLQJ0_07885 [Steroidobacteraceae bacterium]